MSQEYIKAENGESLEEVRKSLVAELGENISVRRFMRYDLGAGLQKKTDDFAAEVAAQTEAAAPAVPAPVRFALACALF